MIIALLALAFAMIVGGLLAAFFGWDIVLVERGWTMVIAGSISAASGALLLGIAAAVSKLAQIETRLSMLRGGFAEAQRVEIRSSDGDLAGGTGLAGGLAAGQGAAAAAEEERPDESQPTLPLFEEGERREQDETAVAIAEWPEGRDPAPVIPFPPRTVSVHPTPRDEEETDLKVPDFLLADRHRDTDDEMPVTDAMVDFEDRQEKDRERESRDRDEDDQHLEPASDLKPEPESASEPEPAADDDDRETAREEEAVSDEAGTATIIGTYDSGDNKYVMYSDGSIEAQTPSGVFRFQSLDELKEFIAAGGEGNSSASI